MKNKYTLHLTIISVAVATMVAIAVVAAPKARQSRCAQAPRFQQSPEYRDPTKCFDCVHPTSQEHWNVSHGPIVSIGM
jgi:hypothetical protein